jgi:2-polyprenyl-3-methyl-5-hydroxy-6-metoxy-1,4-benzoquinol methylase
MSDKFKYRSQQTEWMDDPEIAKELLHQNLTELDILNRKTRGHQSSIKALRKLVSSNHRKLHLVDLGCGSGDVLKYMARWARKNKISARFTGIDSNPHAISYLIENCKNYPEISGVATKYQDYLKQKNPVDIFHSSLFCHHLDDSELLELLVQFKENAKLGFIVNDIIRSPFSYYSSIIFTRLANASALAKHDGPISVLRAFKISEIKQLMEKIDIFDYDIKISWGFRFTLTGKSSFAEANQ